MVTLIPVEKLRPDAGAELAQDLHDYAQRAAEGAFESVLMVLLTPDGRSLLVRIGKPVSVYQTVGMLEGLQWDLLHDVSSETGG